MSYSVLLLFILAAQSANAGKNLCTNPNSLTYPSFGSISTTDPCITFNDPEYLTFMCSLFPIYDCSGTSSTSKRNSAIGICNSRHTGVNVTGIGKLIVGPDPLTFNQSVAYCANIPGCNLWIPQATSSVITPLISDFTVSCDSPAMYWLGIVYNKASSAATDINGAPWAFTTANDMISGPSEAFIFAFSAPTMGIYATNVIFDQLFKPLCQCSN